MHLKKNSSHTIHISDITAEGIGIGDLKGCRVFVNQALPGEIVRVKLIKVTRTYGVGKILEILQTNPNRVSPKCPVFTRCGGCSLQHLAYQAQLIWKTERVRARLRGAGLPDDVQVHHTLGMQSPWEYRNKAQYPVSRTRGEVVMGFYASHSHQIIEHTSCVAQMPGINRVKDIVHRFLNASQISLYDETTHRGLVRHLMVRAGFSTHDIMVVLVINGTELPQKTRFIEQLVSTLPEIKSIVLNINQEKTNVILGATNQVIYGASTITDVIDTCRFEISPHAFYQSNPQQTTVLYRKALEYAALTGRETILDLYCGIGTIAQLMAPHARYVYGVEVVEDAVSNARQNAARNKLTNTEFLQGTAEEVLPRFHAEGQTADVIVIDPPRKGCDERLLRTIVAMQPERMVYVSCHPKTLARDLRYLNAHGLHPHEVQPVDMFPHTTHVECVVRLVRG